MTDQFEFDPERALWKPNRRSFFFGLGAALIAPMLPDVPIPPALKAATGWQTGPVVLLKGDMFTINGVYSIYPQLQDFIVTADVTDILEVLTIPIRPAIASDYKHGKIVFRGMGSSQWNRAPELT